MALLPLVLVLGIYVFYPAFPTVVGKSLGGWTMLACNSANNFVHGRLVPLIFPWMIWSVWRRNQETLLKPSYWGLVWLVVGFLTILAGMRVVQPRWALVGLPFVVMGFTHFLCGWRVTRAVALPSFFLWFMIPVPGLTAILSGWFYPMAIEVILFLANFIGIKVVNEQDMTFLVRGESVRFWIESNSTFTLAFPMFATAAIFFIEEDFLRRWLLFLMIIPLMMGCFVVREMARLLLASIGYTEPVFFSYGPPGEIFYFLFEMAVLVLIAWLMNKIPLRKKTP